MQIDVWSDYACPWCALGIARLDVALRDFEHGDAVSVVHRAFELDRESGHVLIRGIRRGKQRVYIGNHLFV